MSRSWCKGGVACAIAFAGSLAVVPAWGVEDAECAATVDALPGRSFATVQAAIDAAPEGAVVQLSPGRIPERVAIGKPLTLVGAGPDQTVLGPAPDQMQQLRERMERRTEELDSLMRDAEKARDAGHAESQGQAEFQTAAARLYADAKALAEQYRQPIVAIKQARGVALRSLRVTMPDAPERGGGNIVCGAVEIDHADVQLENCAIVHCRASGVQIAGESHVSIDRCLVAACWGSGVSAAYRDGNGARLEIVDSDIRNNYHYNVSAGVDTLVIRGGRIWGSAWSGVSAGGPNVRIEGCVIHDNARAGIYSAGPAGIVTANLIAGNGAGASCWSDDAPRYESNVFFDNRDAAVFVSGPGRPTFRRNLVVGSPLGVAYGPMQITGGVKPPAETFLLQENIFWNTPRPLTVVDSRDAEQDRRTIDLPVEEGNRIVDPHATRLEGESLRVADAQIVGELALKPVVALTTRSPWPLTPEEQAIVPDDGTHDWDKWKMRTKRRRSE